jgi:Flp pilus assembly protein TadB
MNMNLSGKIKMRGQVLLLTSTLNRWCQVRNDILYAFDKALSSDLSPALKKEIQKTLARIKAGMPVEEALSRFSDFSKQEQFIELITALRVSMKHRGDIVSLLENMELQMFKLEEAYQQRRIGNRADLRAAILCFAAALAFFCARLMKPQISACFTTVSGGFIWILFSILCFLAGGIMILAAWYRMCV